MRVFPIIGNQIIFAALDALSIYEVIFTTLDVISKSAKAIKKAGSNGRKE